MNEDIKNSLGKVLEREVSDYLTKPVSISQDHDFMQPKLVRRISLFENKIYTKGKFDKQGNYKFWFDIQTAAINSEVKNIDFDTKNVEIYSPLKTDEVLNTVSNLKMAEYLRDTGQAEEINSAIEEGAGWGNIVWKDMKGGYERVDLKNFYVINQAAKTLAQSPVVERHSLTQTELREAAKKWGDINIEEILKAYGQNIYKQDVESTQQEITTPTYFIYERNGEVNVKDLKEFLREKVEKEDDKKFTFAKVIAIGSEGTLAGFKVNKVLYAKEMAGKNNSDLYEEYHRGAYKGRWWREGIYELTFDLQVRANEIGNQIAQGLIYASKVLFTDSDKLSVQNVITELKNGDYIRSTNFRQVEVRLQGFDQLVADWNRIINLRNELTNSMEVVQGVTPSSGVPLGTSQLVDANANKLYDFIREKLSIPLGKIFGRVVFDLIETIKAEDVLRLTGDSKTLDRMKELIVNDWYLKNLVNLGPHSPEVAEAIKLQKMDELSKKKDLFITGFKKSFENYKPRVSVIITGENTRRGNEKDSFVQFIPLEADPVRRSAMIEEAMRRAGIDVGGLPKSEPEQLQGLATTTQQPEKEVATA